MTTESPSPTPDGFRLWLLVSLGAVAALALFSAGRLKPAYWFLPAFGGVTGLVLRFVADALHVPRTVRVSCLTLLLVGTGAVVCFIPSYNKAAAEWNRRRTITPEDPIAAAMLQQLERDDPSRTAPPFSPELFLAQRYANLSPPWPMACFGAEWLVCVVIAALCVGMRRGRVMKIN